jgi:CubicO group peptidase (beta-lactamase class C family)
MPLINAPRAALALLLLACGAAVSAYEIPATLEDGWPVADAAKLGWGVAQFAQLEARIADGTYKNITSVLIVHRGKLVHEAYFNEGSREHLNDTRSAMKSVTSLLVGAAIDRGAIPNVQAKVYPYFPDKVPVAHPDPRKQAFTLEDLLTMSSLWECDDNNQYSRGNEEAMYLLEDWVQFALDLPIKGFPPWQPKPQDSPFGRAFSYCTAGSFVLGAIVERSTKKRLDQFAREALEAPLGITEVEWHFSPQGIGVGAGGTRYRSRDLAKIGEMVRQGGRWQGRQVISKAWIDASLTNRAEAREGVQYGYLWWHSHFQAKGKDRDVWAASGNGGNDIFIMPDQELVAVITSTAFNKSFAHTQSNEIYQDLVLKALP